MTLALIAGTGRLPELIAARHRPRIYALEGQAPHLDIPIEGFRLETLGSTIAAMKAAGVTRLCLAGAIHRPVIDPARIDAATLPLARRIAAAIGHGDDGALRAIIALFEEAGLTVVAAHDLCPDLLPRPGIPTKRQPTEAHETDAARAAEVVAALGALDIGQSCVAARGQVLAVEALPGTDAMLATLNDRPASLPKGGVLYKAPKPGQDRRVDLPTIGAGTLRNAAQAGLDGVAIEAGDVLMLDAEATIAEADAHNLFIWIRKT